MKRLRHLSCAAVLTLVLSISALAGDILTPGFTGDILTPGIAGDVGFPPGGGRRSYSRVSLTAVIVDGLLE
jgi:hypothetical protein